MNGAGIDERLLYIQFDANGDEELRQYYHANHQGTIIAMSNGGQLTPAKKYTCDCYGAPGEPEDGQPLTLRPFGCSHPPAAPAAVPAGAIIGSATGGKIGYDLGEFAYDQLSNNNGSQGKRQQTNCKQE